MKRDLYAIGSRKNANKNIIKRTESTDNRIFFSLQNLTVRPKLALLSLGCQQFGCLHYLSISTKGAKEVYLVPFFVKNMLIFQKFSLMS